MTTDRYVYDKQDVATPATSAAVITPHDTNEIADIPKAIYIGSPGDVVLRLKDDSADRTFLNMSAGYHPIRPRYIRATGTTATGILALY